MMARYLLEFVTQIWTVLLDLSPALLLGLLLAGLLHAFVPTRLVRRHMSDSTLGSVIRAVLIGVPMPLCSCGVVPTALGLRQQGASNGAVTGFLISTPQTGVDSILVSATFLGWPFAIFKLLAAFVTGILGGWLVNLSEPKPSREATTFSAPSDSGETCGTEVDIQRLSVAAKLREALRYGLFEILAAINTYLVVGILLAALLGVFLPSDVFRDIAWVQGFGGMFLVLLIATPLYICTTASVPLAAALVAAGMPVGTALVFLMAGPATNITTLMLLWRALGRRLTLIYLGVVVVMSFLLGWLFSLGFGLSGSVTATSCHDHRSVVDILSALVLVSFSVYLFIAKLRGRLASHSEVSMSQHDLVLTVGGMTCHHCTATVERTLQSAPGVREVRPDLASGKVAVSGEGLDAADLVRRVREAGYTCEGE